MSTSARPSLPVRTVAVYQRAVPQGSAALSATYACGERITSTVTSTPAAGSPLRKARTATGTSAFGLQRPSHDGARWTVKPPAFASTCTAVPAVAPLTVAITVYSPARLDCGTFSDAVKAPALSNRAVVCAATPAYERSAMLAVPEVARKREPLRVRAKPTTCRSSPPCTTAVSVFTPTIVDGNGACGRNETK